MPVMSYRSTSRLEESAYHYGAGEGTSGPYSDSHHDIHDPQWPSTPNHDDYNEPSDASLSASQTLDAQVPNHVLDEVRGIVQMTMRLQELSLRGLDASTSVVDAAYRRVLWEEQARAQDYPEGNVINKWDTLGQPASIWGLGHYLPETHPWNLKTLATAVQDIYELRGFSFENINSIITPDPRLASWWGQDLDREWLPEIMPNPSPPPLCGQPGVVKRAARVLGAFKWMFQGKDYGYAHMYALRLSGSFYYAIVQELSKAVPLRNILRNLMGSCDLAEAWRRVGEEKRAAGRVQFQDFEG